MTMRRIVIILIVVLVVIIALARVTKPKKKQVAEQRPPQQSEIVLGKAIELKSQDPNEAIIAFEKVIADFPGTAQAEKAYAEIAGMYKQQGNLSQEKAALRALIEAFPEGESAAQAKERLWAMNINELFSGAKTDSSTEYVVQSGDTLYKIAREFGTNVDLIMKANKIESSLIRPGMKLRVNQAVFSLFVDKSDRVMTVYSGDQVLKQYPIGVGEDNSTPEGTFKIVNRIVDPVWYKTGAIVPAGSAENILGSRWLGLSEPGYGIHGTTDTGPIQDQKTQGCIRMNNAAVEELFVYIPVGTKVEIVE